MGDCFAGGPIKVFGVIIGETGYLLSTINRGLLSLFLVDVVELLFAEGNGELNDVCSLSVSLSECGELVCVVVSVDFTPCNCCRIMIGDNASKSIDGDVRGDWSLLFTALSLYSIPPSPEFDRILSSG